MSKTRLGAAKSWSRLQVGVLLCVSFLLGVIMGRNSGPMPLWVSSLSKEKTTTTSTTTPSNMEIRFTVERNQKHRDQNLNTSSNKVTINSRILKAVFGEVTDPLLRTLQELSNAQPSLTESVDLLESRIAEFAFMALESMRSTLDMNNTINLLKEPGPPTIIIHNASYGPKSGVSGKGIPTRADVKWLLEPLIHNSVLRIPRDYPLVHLFGTKPKGEDGGGENFLDIDAETAAGPVSVSIEAPGGKLASDLVISSARSSREIFLSKDEIQEELKRITTGKRGLEIGGPSSGFEEAYKTAATTDLVNFSEKTLWGTFLDGSTFNYKGGGTGIVHITDGSTLDGIDDNSYDFVFGSHYLEHLNNPFKALASIKRVLKTGGHAVLILPRKEACFDHFRGHGLLEDLLVRYLHKVSESDMRYSNAEAWILGNSLSKDRGAGTFEQLQARTIRYPVNKAIHTMVYDFDLLEILAKSLSFEVVRMGMEKNKNLHQWIFIKKM
jgi:SAM-dependent methyltransferase